MPVADIVQDGGKFPRVGRGEGRQAVTALAKAMNDGRVMEQEKLLRRLEQLGDEGQEET